MNSTYNDKLVSFVLISYNQEKYIEDALLSVLEQDYSNLEIIVSDDGSTDNTKNIINVIIIIILFSWIIKKTKA
ncbi:hypothetical protein UA45_05225 [Morganella morganii]|uniref:Glycosyltransferase 2-like domain-containing protein n=1 Tax=Morganella morganii TaxID=582 RepID=A0A0D8L9M8_MORMO|nr:hypothetical protein UA45_05225 [Morganella morganii]